MAVQQIFDQSVSHYLPFAMPTDVGCCDDYTIGKILLYKEPPEKKATKVSKKKLQFIGYSISALLTSTANSLSEITCTSDFVVDSKRLKQKPAVLFDLDEHIIDEMLDFPPSDERRRLSVSSKFGKITRVCVNVYDVFSSKSPAVKTNHEVIKQAMANGGVLFVISTLYEAEKVEIEIRAPEDSSKVLRKVCDLGTTPIGFSVVKMTISSNGTIKPTLNRRTYSSATKNQGVEYTGFEALRLNPRLSFDDNGWVIVNKLECFPDVGVMKADETTVVGEEKLAPTVEILGKETVMQPITTPKKKQEPLDDVDTKKLPEKPAPSPTKTRKKIVEPLEDAALPEKPAPSPTKTRKKIVEPLEDAKTHSPLPEGERSSTTPQPKPMGAEPAKREYRHTQEAFKHFVSSTYEDLMKEVKDWVQPLLDNPALQKAFFDHIAAHKTSRKLTELQKYLKSLDHHIRDRKTLPVGPTNLKPVVSKLTDLPSVKLDEVTALLIAIETFKKMRSKLLKSLCYLPLDERETLKEIIKETPYGVRNHTHLGKQSTYINEHLFSVFIQLGYAVEAGNLVYNGKDTSLKSVVVVLETSSNL